MSQAGAAALWALRSRTTAIVTAPAFAGYSPPSPGLPSSRRLKPTISVQWRSSVIFAWKLQLASACHPLRRTQRLVTVHARGVRLFESRQIRSLPPATYTAERILAADALWQCFRAVNERYGPTSPPPRLQ